MKTTNRLNLLEFVQFDMSSLFECVCCMCCVSSLYSFVLCYRSWPEENEEEEQKSVTRLIRVIVPQYAHNIGQYMYSVEKAKEKITLKKMKFVLVYFILRQAFIYLIQKKI